MSSDHHTRKSYPSASRNLAISSRQYCKLTSAGHASANSNNMMNTNPILGPLGLSSGNFQGPETPNRIFSGRERQITSTGMLDTGNGLGQLYHDTRKSYDGFLFEKDIQDCGSYDYAVSDENVDPYFRHQGPETSMKFSQPYNHNHNEQEVVSPSESFRTPCHPLSDSFLTALNGSPLVRKNYLKPRTKVSSTPCPIFDKPDHKSESEYSDSLHTSNDKVPGQSFQYPSNYSFSFGNSYPYAFPHGSYPSSACSSSLTDLPADYQFPRFEYCAQPKIDTSPLSTKGHGTSFRNNIPFGSFPANFQQREGMLNDQKLSTGSYTPFLTNSRKKIPPTFLPSTASFDTSNTRYNSQFGYQELNTKGNVPKRFAIDFICNPIESNGGRNGVMTNGYKLEFGKDYHYSQSRTMSPDNLSRTSSMSHFPQTPFSLSNGFVSTPMTSPAPSPVSVHKDIIFQERSGLAKRGRKPRNVGFIFELCKPDLTKVVKMPMRGTVNEKRIKNDKKEVVYKFKNYTPELIQQVIDHEALAKALKRTGQKPVYMINMEHNGSGELKKGDQVLLN